MKKIRILLIALILSVFCTGCSSSFNPARIFMSEEDKAVLDVEEAEKACQEAEQAYIDAKQVYQECLTTNRDAAIEGTANTLVSNAINLLPDGKIKSYLQERTGVTEEQKTAMVSVDDAKTEMDRARVAWKDAQKRLESAQQHLEEVRNGTAKEDATSEEDAETDSEDASSDSAESSKTGFDLKSKSGIVIIIVVAVVLIAGVVLLGNKSGAAKGFAVPQVAPRTPAPAPVAPQPPAAPAPVGPQEGYYQMSAAMQEINAYCASRGLNPQAFIKQCGSVDAAIVTIRGYK